MLPTFARCLTLQRAGYAAALPRLFCCLIQRACKQFGVNAVWIRLV
jgi:hypothetical protein